MLKKIFRVFWCFVAMAMIMWSILIGLVVDVVVIIVEGLVKSFAGYEWLISVVLVLAVASFMYDSIVPLNESKAESDIVESEEE